MNKLINLFVVLTIFSANAAWANEYISSYDLTVVGSKAYLIETAGDTKVIKQYSFPGLVASNQVTLDENFSYAYADSEGIVITNYDNDVPTESFTTNEDGSQSKVYKETYTLQSYDLNLEPIASKVIENTYYYSYTTDSKATDDSAGGSALSEKTKCGHKKAKHKGKNCNKITL